MGERLEADEFIQYLEQTLGKIDPNYPTLKIYRRIYKKG